MYPLPSIPLAKAEEEEDDNSEEELELDDDSDETVVLADAVATTHSLTTKMYSTNRPINCEPTIVTNQSKCFGPRMTCKNDWLDNVFNYNEYHDKVPSTLFSKSQLNVGSSSGGGALTPNRSLPQSSSDNISRSVSFNDKYLSKVNRAKSSSAYLSRNSDTPSPPARKEGLGATVKRQASTPGRLQEVVNRQSPLSARFEPPPLQPRKSIKHITASLARKLSFRKSPSDNQKNKTVRQGYVTESPIYDGMKEPQNAIVSYEALVKLFECPGCTALMSPPLLQCRKGHLLCERCRVSLKLTCPICQQRTEMGSANIMMEQVYQLINFPCRFGKYGCSDYYPPKQKSDHESMCQFRPIHCNYETQGCDCVLPLKQMTKHVENCQFKE